VVLKSEWIVLSDAICFRVSGKDSRRYLHNRLSQDIRALMPGQSARAVALSAQGRVEGVFSVWCEGEGRFLLVCDGGDPRVVGSALKRFIVADRVVCDDISSQVSLVHVVSEEPLLASGIEQVGLRIICRFTRGRIDQYGVDLLIGSGDRAALLGKLGECFGPGLAPERYD